MLAVKNLQISFSRYSRGLARTTMVPLYGIDLDLAEGEVVAIVGESGGGKSLLAHAILGILPDNATVKGNIRFRGRKLSHDTIKKLRGRAIALVPQSVSCLNPLLQVGRQVRRVARVAGLTRKEARKVTDMAFARFDLAPATQDLLPFQLSGGMAQRVLVAMATVGGASLLIADEPTTGLDGERIADFIKLLRMLTDDGKAVLLITHDLETAWQTADRIAVFCGGTLVEVVNKAGFSGVDSFAHPYTRILWQALPVNGFEAGSGGGHGYNPNDEPKWKGCMFVDGCERAGTRCRMEFPDLIPYQNGLVRCLNA